jgi:undecaprenyl-diphosphatase
VPILHAIVLGLVQGLSEFLPISSSGHLLLVPWLFDWHDFDDKATEKAFDVALHLGTVAAVCIYFRADIARYVKAGWRVLAGRRRPVDTDGRVAILLVVSSIPAALVGAAFQTSIDNELGRPWIIAVSLIVFGVVLAWADRLAGRRHVDQLTTRDAIAVGAAQVLALNPGTSRSGITMSAGRWLGFDRDAAARLSFLMSIPITAGAVALKLAGLVKDGVPSDLRVPMLVGILTSGVSGWIAISGLLKLIRTRSFMPFVVYRLALGAFVLLVLAAGWR